MVVHPPRTCLECGVVHTVRVESRTVADFMDALTLYGTEDRPAPCCSDLCSEAAEVRRALTLPGRTFTYHRPILQPRFRCTITKDTPRCFGCDADFPLEYEWVTDGNVQGTPMSGWRVPT